MFMGVGCAVGNAWLKSSSSFAVCITAGAGAGVLAVEKPCDGKIMSQTESYASAKAIMFDNKLSVFGVNSDAILAHTCMMMDWSLLTIGTLLCWVVVGISVSEEVSDMSTSIIYDHCWRLERQGQSSFRYVCAFTHGPVRTPFVRA